MRALRSIIGKYSPQIFQMNQSGTRTNVAIWAPIPRGKLLKAQFSGVIVSTYNVAGRGDGSPLIERITFTAASGKLR